MRSLSLGSVIMKKYSSALMLFILFSISNKAEEYTAEYNIVPLFNSPIEYKLYVDNAVMKQNIDPLIDILISEDEEHQNLRENYPFAQKLYRILDNKTAAEDFTTEAQHIPLQDIMDVTRRLAIEGDNDQFLANTH